MASQSKYLLLLRTLTALKSTNQVYHHILHKKIYRIKQSKLPRKIQHPLKDSLLIPTLDQLSLTELKMHATAAKRKPMFSIPE